MAPIDLDESDSYEDAELTEPLSVDGTRKRAVASYLEFSACLSRVPNRKITVAGDGGMGWK
jgi:hypothetical protein